MVFSYIKGFNNSHDGLLSWFHQELSSKMTLSISLIISHNRWRQQCYLINASHCLSQHLSNSNFTSTTFYFFGIVWGKPHTHIGNQLIWCWAVRELTGPCYHRHEGKEGIELLSPTRKLLEVSCSWKGSGRTQNDLCSIFVISPLKRSICWFYERWPSELL